MAPSAAWQDPTPAAPPAEQGPGYSRRVSTPTPPPTGRRLPSVEERCAGGVVIDVHEGRARIAVIARRNRAGRIEWCLPKGHIEPGETLVQTAAREVAEETGITVTRGRLVAVDTRPAKRAKALGLRFLFDCGVVSAESVKGVAVQAEEVREYRFASPAEALELLRPAVSRRVAAALKSQHCIYLQDGNPVAGVMA